MPTALLAYGIWARVMLMHRIEYVGLLSQLIDDIKNEFQHFECVTKHQDLIERWEGLYVVFITWAIQLM